MRSRSAARTGAELRRRILAEHQIDSAGALALLDCACRAFDQALAAEAVLAREGLTVPGSRGPRPHPCVSISRDARNRLINSLRILNLEP
jgi:phage terminase small subunit